MTEAVGLPPVAAVLFDLDETLIHHRADDAAAFAAVAARVGVAPAALAAAVRAAALPLWRAGPAFPYCDRIGISWSEGLAGPFGPAADPDLQRLHVWVPEFRRRTWAAALAALGRDDAALAARAAAAFAAERLARVTPYADAAAVLAALAPRHRLGLVTNGAPDLQRWKLDRSGLAPFFAAVVISGEVGVGKPDPAILRLALQRLGGLPPAQAVMVGDNPARDVAAARAAGLAAVLVDRGEAAEPERPSGPPPDATVTSLGELLALLSPAGAC